MNHCSSTEVRAHLREIKHQYFNVQFSMKRRLLFEIIKHTEYHKNLFIDIFWLFIFSEIKMILEN